MIFEFLCKVKVIFDAYLQSTGMLRSNKNIKIIFNYVIGPLLGVWLFYSLYQQVKAQPNLHESLSLIKHAPFGENAWKFWLTLLLVFANWGIESKKWQVLMGTLERLPYLVAVKSVLSGVTLSLNTPNRIGEYGGRILFVGEGKRIRSISLSIAGSMCQLVITLFMGCGGLIFLLWFEHPNEEMIMGLSIFWIRILAFVSALAGMIILLFLFRLSWVIKLLERVNFLSRFVKYVNVLDEFTPSFVLRILLLSLLRYTVFVAQYVLLLQVLHVDVNWMQGFWVITILYLVMAIVPSFAIADLGIRGKFSTELLGLYSVNTIGILSATFGIWFINLFIPALAGSLLIIGKRIFKEN
jgi:hypothetical protein